MCYTDDARPPLPPIGGAAADQGDITLTSVDGTVLVAKAGEGVAIPKGWKGHWSTQGYKKYYVTYSGGVAEK